MSDHDGKARSGSRLSYKFQRVREQIRQAVIGGELVGKLPGERELGRRFSVNAKTLGKALTDLAAEGLLERTVGRGTFVRGAARKAGAARQLLALHAAAANADTVAALRELPDAKVQLLNGEPLRPSFLSAFDRVVALGVSADHEAIRGLITRGVKVALIDPPVSTISTHAARSDSHGSVVHAVRMLSRHGHRRIYYAGHDSELRAAAEEALWMVDRECALLGQCPCDAQPDSILAADATAVVLETSGGYGTLRDGLTTASRNIPGHMSVVGIGVIHGPPPCAGVYVQAESLVQSALRLLADESPGRPATLWHAGHWHEGDPCTVGCPPGARRA